MSCDNSRRPVSVVPAALCAVIVGACATSPVDDTRPQPAPHESVGAFFSTHFSGDAWHENVVCDYLTEPPVLLPAGLAVAAGVSAFSDRAIERSADRQFGNGDSVADSGLVALVAGSVALGVFAPGEGRNACDEPWTQAEAFALTLGATEGLKTVVGRHRPDSEQKGSFPSGHASIAFAAATLTYRNSGPSIGIPAYGVAAITAIARVHDRGHYPSDAFAGAALGVFSAGVVDALHWGTGRHGRGIAGRGPEVALGVEPEEGGGLAAVLTLRF